MSQQLIQLLVNGVAIGSIVALGSVGLRGCFKSPIAGSKTVSIPLNPP